MSLVIVPNELSEAIHEKLRAAAEGLILTSEEYDQHYKTLLQYFDEHGTIPYFTLAPKESSK